MVRCTFDIVASPLQDRHNSLPAPLEALARLQQLGGAEGTVIGSGHTPGLCRTKATIASRGPSRRRDPRRPVGQHHSAHRRAPPRTARTLAASGDPLNPRRGPSPLSASTGPRDHRIVGYGSTGDTLRLAGMGGSSLIQAVGPLARHRRRTRLDRRPALDGCPPITPPAPVVADAETWIPVTTVAWSIGVAIPVIALSVVPNGWPPAVHVVVAVGAAVAMGATVGVITGPTLVRFANDRDEQTTPNPGSSAPAYRKRQRP